MVLFADTKGFSISYSTQPFSMVVGDFNSDNKVNFTVANRGTDNFEIFFTDLLTS
jgi:hypothetical protein